MTGWRRAVRLATALAAMGLVFMGAIVLPVYLVPALTAILALGLAAEAHPSWRPTAVHPDARPEGRLQPEAAVKTLPSPLR